MDQSLGEKAKLSVLWNTGFNLFRDALQFVVMLILVRILDPEAYGQFGLATSVVGFISVFSFQNYVAYNMQLRREEEVNFQIHFTVGAYIQFVLFLFANVVAFILGYHEKYAAISPYVHILSLTFFMEWPTEIAIKKLEIALDWKKRRILHGIGLVISSLVAIMMGILGGGVYSLVIPGLVVTVPFIYDLFFVVRWKPTWEWSREKFSPAFRFGLSRMGSGLVVRARPLLESGCVTQYVGFVGVGLLGRANGLATIFCQKLATQLMYSIYPVLTKIEPNSERYRKISSVIVRVVAWIVIPLATIFSFCASPLVSIVYGEKWLDVIELLPWAMAISVCSSMTHVFYMLLLAHNNHKMCLIVDLLLFLSNTAIFVLLLYYGLMKYIMGLLAINLVAMFVSAYFLVKDGGANIVDILYSVIIPVSVSAVAIALVSLLFYSFEHIDRGFLSSVLFGSLFLSIYLLLIRILFRGKLAEIVNYMPLKNIIRRLLYI